MKIASTTDAQQLEGLARSLDDHPAVAPIFSAHAATCGFRVGTQTQRRLEARSSLAVRQTKYVATQQGEPGLTDSDILSELASRFNALYDQSGLTAHYDSATDTLSFDQSLNPDLLFLETDTDTGIGFGMSLYSPGFGNSNGGSFAPLSIPQ